MVYACVETVRPRYFAPIERTVRSGVEGTTIRLRRASRYGDQTQPSMWSMWSVWLGVHIGFGLGLFSSGLMCLLIAAHGFAVVESVAAIRPLTIAFGGLSLRFFDYVQVIITATATVCFTVAALLSS